MYLLSPEVLEFAEIPVFVSGEYDVGQDGRYRCLRLRHSQMLYGHSMVQAFADQHPLGILMKQTRVLPGQLRTNPIFLETIVLVYLNTATP